MGSATAVQAPAWQRPLVSEVRRLPGLACPPPRPGLQICVVLPVRNEAAGLDRTLAALAGQKELDGRAFDATRFEVLLLANNCQDGSAALARAFGAHHPQLALHVAEVQLPAAQANIGHARGLLMDTASERLGASAHAQAFIASTDGDSVVASDWLAQTRVALAAGADAVGGRIRFDPSCPLDPGPLRWHRLDAAVHLARCRLEDLLDPVAADPWPRHHQHYGASLAVTLRAYRQVGGLPRVPHLEDQALVDALGLLDLRLRHSAAVKVLTSARQDGRAEVGLAWQLRTWAQAGNRGGSLMVDEVAGWARQLQGRQRLRALWSLRQAGTCQRPARQTAALWALTSHARAWGLAPAWLAARAQDAEFFGGLWAEVQARALPIAPAPAVPARRAIDELHALIATRLAREAWRSSTSMR